MTESQPTNGGVPGVRTRTITTVLMILLVTMIIRDIFARRRAAAAAGRSPA